MGTVDTVRQGIATDITCNDGVSSGDGMSQVEQTTQLRYRLASASGSWGREFRLLLVLADGRGVSLDECALAFYDVRDLQALQWRIVATGASRRGLVARR